MRQRLKNLGWVAVGAIVLYWAATTLVGTVFGGPLDPPAAPAETQKTQITSLPYTISAPGSYVVMDNLVCNSCGGGGDGITVESSNVTIDLNGFQIRGVAGSASGIIVSGSRSGVTVKNGIVSAWDLAGIQFSACSRCRIEYVEASQNGTVGGGAGIAVGGTSVVSNVIAAANQASGIYVSGIDNVISESLVRGSAVGIVVDANGNVLQANTLRSNADGIRVTSSGNWIEGNSSNANIGNGFEVTGSGNVIVRNSARANGTEYVISAGNTFGDVIAGPVDPLASTNSWANLDY